jgi:phosphopantothenoylcysteine decarboxylase / phosphopantothenate---cysteine ligase
LRARMSRILLGVTGSIAAYKACEVIRLLVKEGHEVVPIPTPDSERFVGVHTLEALARRDAPSDLYPHLMEADALAIVPLSANTLAKLAHGLSDNVLTQTALAFRGPFVVAPAMNVRMWEHPATQANVALLRERGVEIVGPETGELAEGETGLGRMSEPEAIVEAILRAAGGIDPSPTTTKDLAGRSILVTAGGTREPIDSVRFVGNRSSGRMGVALAGEAARRGADVTLVAANVDVSLPRDVRVVEAPTAADLRRETLARAEGADAVLMAAAVADYRPGKPVEGKRPKDREPWTIELEPTEDVLAELARRGRNGQVLVGFAADEGECGLERAREKLASKGGNFFVFNDVSRSDIGFDAEDNEIVLLSDRGERKVSKRSKAEVAVAVLDEVALLLKGD